MRLRARDEVLSLALLASVVCGASNGELRALPPRACPEAAANGEHPGTVPAVHTVASHFSRVIVIRLKSGTDVLEGLRTAVAREKIKNSVILSGAGSLTSYHVHVVSNTTFPPTNAFIKGEGPFDLLTATGYVIDGRVHAHITFADTQKTLGGHLEPGTKVFTFAVITLGVLEEGASLKRADDYTWR